jgi:hypothetical protein
VFFAFSVFTLSSIPEYVPHLSFTSPNGYGLNEKRKTKNEKRKTKNEKRKRKKEKGKRITNH